MELFSLLAKLTLDSSDFEKNLNNAQRDADDFEMPETPELELETEDFENGVKDAETLGEGFKDKMTGIFDGIKGALAVTGIVGLVAGVVNGIKEAVNLTAQTADGIDKGSARLGISKRKYQEWDHALRQSGASISDLQKGVINFNKYIASFEPGAKIEEADQAIVGAGGDMAQAFARLQISVKKSNGELKTSEELIEETLVALSDFKGTEEERGVLVTQLFGRGGMSLNAFLNSGKEGVQDLLAEADKLGLIMSDEDITEAVAYGDAVANLNAELESIKMAFVTDIIPLLKDAALWLTDFLTQLNPRLQTNNIFAVIDKIDSKTVAASRKVDEATETAKKLIEELKNMGDYWTLDEQGRMTWDALADKALELFPQLSDYIDTDGKKIQGNTKDIEANIDAWARLEKQRLLSAAMDEKSEAVAKQLLTAYDKGAKAREKAIEADVKRSAAIKELNKYLSEESKLSENASFEEFQEARTNLLNTINPEVNLREFNEVSSIGSEYSKAEIEARALQEESSKMIAEAEEANAKLGEYQEYLIKVMGLATEETGKSTEKVKTYRKELDKIPSEIRTELVLDGIMPTLPWNKRAIGDSYIPYDNFPALLHRGERVLTATEVRRGEGSGIDYTRLEDSIIESIRAGMADASVTAVVTDRQVARGSNRYNGNEMDSRRFRP